MKKRIQFFILLYCLFSCTQQKTKVTESPKNKYIFFLHNLFLENNPPGTFDEKFKQTAQYYEILQSFKYDGFNVISELRKPNTDGLEYAKKVVKQIDSLQNLGIKPVDITVIGTSKGGYIAEYVSTLAKNPNLNFVFIGAYQDSDIKDIPDINFCGNILNIYDKSDVYGVSAKKRVETSKLKVNHFNEVVLNTGLKHGFLYLALDEWIKPCKLWAMNRYDLK